MRTEQLRTAARRGDWIRVHATAHTAPRQGRIMAVEGPPGHECFRVRWEVYVDENQTTASKFNVRSIPSILFFKGGKHVDTVVGSVPKATLEGKIKQHLV